MGETLVRCPICKKQKPCTVSPIPPLWRCDACERELGPWPPPEPPVAGICRAEGGHDSKAVYETRFGPLCIRHLKVVRRTAIYPGTWKADG